MLIGYADVYVCPAIIFCFCHFPEQLFFSHNFSVVCTVVEERSNFFSYVNFIYSFCSWRFLQILLFFFQACELPCSVNSSLFYALCHCT